MTRVMFIALIAFFSLFAVSCLFFPAILYAEDVPAEMNYQGYVQEDGTAIDDTGWFKFALVNSDGDISYWSNDGTSTVGDEPADAISTTVSEGVFSVILGDTGSMQALDKTIFSNGVALYLRVWFCTTAGGTYEQLSPDKKLTASAYAINCDAFDNTIKTSLTLDSDNEGFGADITIIANQGSDSDGGLKYSASNNRWEISNDGGAYAAIGTGTGDITAVGDVTSGDAFVSGGTQGTSLWFYDADGAGRLTIADLSTARTYTLPDTTGTIALTSSLGDYLNKDGSVSLTADWDAGGYEIRAETFESDVATGTAPFTIASTTVVGSLNADQVDGKDSTDLLLTDGTQAMGAALNVGDNNITNVSNIALDTISSDAGSTVTVTLGTGSGDDFIVGNNNALVVEGDNDRVGIGTNTPAYELDVAGDIRATGDLIGVDLGEFDNRSFNWEELQKLLFQSEVPTVITKATMGGVDADTYMASMAVYDTELYVGTQNTTAATDSTATKVLNYDGSSWSAITKATMGGVAADTNTNSMAVYNSKLYIGTKNDTAATDSTAAKLLVYDGSWSVITKATMGGVASDTQMASMAVYDSKLYIGTKNTTVATDATGAKVLVYDNSSWSAITKATMGGVTTDTTFRSMAVYNGKLYIGTKNATADTDATGAKVLCYDGSSWSAITKATMGGVAADSALQSMAVYNGKLYIGTENTTANTNSTAAKVVVYDGNNWSIITKATMGGANADKIMSSMAVYNGKLYIGTNNTTSATDSTGAKLLVYDGTTWGIITKDEMGGAVDDDENMKSMAVYNGRLYVGTINTTADTDATAAKVCRFKVPICQTENDYCPRGF